jgi:hypothetical protein
MLMAARISVGGDVVADDGRRQAFRVSGGAFE